MEKNVLFIYSDASQRRDFSYYFDYIHSILDDTFSQIDFFKSPSLEDTLNKATESCGKYHSLVIVSGDGTFQHVLSRLATVKEELPNIGFINKGTLGDVGKNFGINRNIKRSLKIIKNGYTCPADFIFDGKVGFEFVAAIGNFADIPYSVNRKAKKLLRRFSYYALATTELFSNSLIHYHVYGEEIDQEGEAPFIMLMNGKYVGGFKVNRKSKINDGKIELFLSKKGAFGGLLKYMFNRNKPIIITKDVTIEIQENISWDYDGEQIEGGIKTFSIMHDKFKIYAKK